MSTTQDIPRHDRNMVAFTMQDVLDAREEAARSQVQLEKLLEKAFGAPLTEEQRTRLRTAIEQKTNPQDLLDAVR